MDDSNGIQQQVGLENAQTVDLSEYPVILLYKGKRLMWFEIGEVGNDKGEEFLRLDGFAPRGTSIYQDDEPEPEFPWTTITVYPNPVVPEQDNRVPLYRLMDHRGNVIADNCRSWEEFMNAAREHDKKTRNKLSEYVIWRELFPPDREVMEIIYPMIFGRVTWFDGARHFQKF